MDYVVDGEHSTLVKEEIKPQVKNPPFYKVILLNDDFTPMDFVVEILQQFFYMSREQAVQIMLAVHQQGKGVCGVFTRDVAETKVEQVNNYSRQSEYPLLCLMEVA